MDWSSALLVLFISASLVSYILLYCFHGRAVDCQSDVRLDGKTALITGGSSGIGRETAMLLAMRGAKLILASRSQLKGERAVSYIIEKTGNGNVRWEHVDLGSHQSVHELARLIQRTESQLHVLINNAGISNSQSAGLNSHGYDPVFAVNYLGHFLLTYLLLDLLRASAPSRIVNVSSYSHHFVHKALELNLAEHSFYSASSLDSILEGYNLSKFALALHATELCRRLSGSGVTANYLHPGLVYTDLWKQSMRDLPRPVRLLMHAVLRPFFITPVQGAQTSVYCATDRDLDSVSGHFFRKCRQSRPSNLVHDVKQSARLWEVSKLLTGCTENGRAIDSLPYSAPEVEQVDRDTMIHRLLKQTVTVQPPVVNSIERV